MDQCEIQNPTQNNCNKSTYLTTFQKFLSKQSESGEQTEKNRETRVDDQQPNKRVLLNNGFKQHSQMASSDSKQLESKQLDSVNGTFTNEYTNDEEVANYESNSLDIQKTPVKRRLHHKPSRNAKRNRTDNTSSDDSLMSDVDSIISNESPAELPDKPVMAYECAICQLETIYEDVFKEHMLTHKKRETFHRCPKCDFRMKCRAEVRKHMILEDEDIEYCGLYSYSAACKGQLASHLRVHGKNH